MSQEFDEERIKEILVAIDAGDKEKFTDPSTMYYTKACALALKNILLELQQIRKEKA